MGGVGNCHCCGLVLGLRCVNFRHVRRNGRDALSQFPNPVESLLKETASASQLRGEFALSTLFCWESNVQNVLVVVVCGLSKGGKGGQNSVGTVANLCVDPARVGKDTVPERLRAFNDTAVGLDKGKADKLWRSLVQGAKGFVCAGIHGIRSPGNGAEGRNRTPNTDKRIENHCIDVLDRGKLERKVHRLPHGVVAVKMLCRLRGHVVKQNWEKRVVLKWVHVKFFLLPSTPPTMSATSKLLSKRYPGTTDHLPRFARKHFDRMQRESQPAFQRANAPQVRRGDRFTTPEQWKLQVGDKVLITRGQHKGTVSEVVHLQSETNRVFLQVHSARKVVVPKSWWSTGQTSHVIDYPASFSTRDLKLVAAVPQEDGTTTEIAAYDVVLSGEEWDPDYKRMMPIRRVRYNEHITIPWPRPDPVEECELSTPEELAHERTYYPTSLAGDATVPDDLIQSLRHPLMKRPYKWGDRVFSRGEIAKLRGPQMPVSAAKLAGRAERAALAASLPKEPSTDTVEVVGSRVAEFLNAIENPHYAKFVSRLAPDYKDPAAAFREAQKKLRDARVADNQALNKIKTAVRNKYRARR